LDKSKPYEVSGAFDLDLSDRNYTDKNDTVERHYNLEIKYAAGMFCVACEDSAQSTTVIENGTTNNRSQTYSDLFNLYVSPADDDDDETVLSSKTARRQKVATLTADDLVFNDWSERTLITKVNFPSEVARDNLRVYRNLK
jgi:hypothetical protein